MKKLMRLLFLSCLKATELIEKRLHYKLVWHETLQLKVHKMMCDACKRYEKQSIFLDKSMAKKLKMEESIWVDLENLKQQIQAKLAEKPRYE
jgi:hypothetical protein